MAVCTTDMAICITDMVICITDMKICITDMAICITDMAICIRDMAISSPRVERPGRGGDHPPHLAMEDELISTFVLRSVLILSECNLFTN